MRSFFSDTECHLLLELVNLHSFLAAQTKITRSHTITEWFGLELTLNLILFQPPCHAQGHLPPDQVAQSSIQPGLEHSVNSLSEFLDIIMTFRTGRE